jgi:hypothetical protein
VHAPTKDKDDIEDSFYEELEQIFYHFPRYGTKILVGNFNANVGREEVSYGNGNESLHEISNDNGVRVIHFATSKNLVFKSITF